MSKMLAAFFPDSGVQAGVLAKMVFYLIFIATSKVFFIMCRHHIDLTFVGQYTILQGNNLRYLPKKF